MNNKIKILLVGIISFNLSSCMTVDDELTSGYQGASYYNGQMYVPQSSDVSYDNYQYEASKEVVVPNSYHVGELHSPVSFHERDQSWVNSQNPQGYTIELTQGDKASKVAQVLYKTPKNDRMAQIKYQQGSKEYYRGLYGTYSSADEAKKALEALPPEIKNGASIKNWSSVQH